MAVTYPSDLNPEFLKKIEDKYGKIDMKNDFFSDDLKRYMKTAEIESEEDGGAAAVPRRYGADQGQEAEGDGLHRARGRDLRRDQDPAQQGHQKNQCRLT